MKSPRIGLMKYKSYKEIGIYAKGYGGQAVMLMLNYGFAYLGFWI